MLVSLSETMPILQPHVRPLVMSSAIWPHSTMDLSRYGSIPTWIYPDMDISRHGPILTWMYLDMIYNLKPIKALPGSCHDANCQHGSLVPMPFLTSTAYQLPQSVSSPALADADRCNCRTPHQSKSLLGSRSMDCEQGRRKGALHARAEPQQLHGSGLG